MASWRVLGSALAVTLVASVSAAAAPHRTAACAAPKPLPASLKRPPAGATATQFANFLLALPQRKPCDVNLFTSTFPGGTKGTYPEGERMSRPSGPVTDERVRTQLAEFMPAGSKRARALSLFGRADVKAKIPEPTFRAAFAALVGTPGEADDRRSFGRGRMPADPPCRRHASEGAVADRRLRPAVEQSIVINAQLPVRALRVAQLGVIPHEILHHDSMSLDACRGSDPQRPDWRSCTCRSSPSSEAGNDREPS